MERLKNSVDWVNSHLSLVIAVPAVLGGLWQLISLMAIDPAYIRFFSATQLLADGLFLIVVFIAFLVPIVMYIIAEIASDRILPKIKNNINEIGQTKFSIGLIIFLIVLNIVSIFITVDYYSSFNYQVLTLFKLTEVPWFVVNAYSSILIPIVLYDYFRNGTTKISIMGWNKYTISFTLVIIVTFIIVLQNFNRSFAVPNNLKNVNLIINSNTKIVYFNDQYIFLEIKKEDKIKVLKFDDFFEENKAAD